jgi:hypothetical protein
MSKPRRLELMFLELSMRMPKRKMEKIAIGSWGWDSRKTPRLGMCGQLG